jgi:hypothetical protein
MPNKLKEVAAANSTSAEVMNEWSYTSTQPLQTRFNGVVLKQEIRGCIQKFPEWPPGAKTVYGRALCH